MPDGSQAWKMIRPPGTHVERIAQACDRCRSKKIKCDGTKPQCSQCKNVGFECRTSDKLSRRSFPRGYTESLENRVRELESMTKQLNREIDLKDEQLEMLAKVDAFSHRSQSEARRRSSSSPTRVSNDDNDEEYVEKFTISECDLEGGESFKGPSSGNYFLSLFRQKAGRKHPHLESLLAGFSDCLNKEPHSSGAYKNAYSSQAVTASLPSRMETDELVTVFFQYWHAFFPILHKPSFLEEYRQAYSDPRKANSEFLIKLYVILSISSLNRAAKFGYEAKWRRLLDLNNLSPSINNLQILLLVQLFSCLVGRSSDMYQYKCMSVGMAVRLGLHRCQKHFKLSVMGSEIRRRLFWVTYVLDCFSSAAVGAPVLMNEKDIECVYPSDVDDEYITEAAILSPAPGKFTHVSAFLGLVRGARVMSSILSLLYNSKKVQTFKVIMELEDLLEEWRTELPHHLKFEFSGGSPRGSVSGLHTNAPLLLVLYHHMRLLIHRPAIATEGSRTAGSGSITKLMDSSKQIIQLANFLKSRRQRWTICLCEAQVLVMSGIGVLYLAMDYPRTGLLFKECSKSMGLCLDGIYEHPSFSDSLYQHFEKLYDGIFGISESSKDKESKERKHHHKPSNSMDARLKLPTPPGSDMSMHGGRKLSQYSPESDSSDYSQPNIGAQVAPKPQVNSVRNPGFLPESFIFDKIKSGLPSPAEEDDYGTGIPANTEISKQANLDLDKYLPLFNINQEIPLSAGGNAKKETHHIVDFPALYVASDGGDSSSNTESEHPNEIQAWPAISGIDCDGSISMPDDNYDNLFNNLWKSNDHGTSMFI